MDIRQRINDALRERRIGRLRRKLVEAKGSVETMAVWCLLRDEINSRSAAQVRRMEEQRGLL